MPRRGNVPKRDVLPDPIYKSKVVTKLVNQVMYDGKRGVAQAVCYDAFDKVAAKTGKEAMEEVIKINKDFLREKEEKR